MIANGTPGAANPLLDALDKTRRVRQLVRQIAARAPRLRGVLYAQRRDLAELCDLTATDAGDVLASLDGLDRNIADLLSYAAAAGARDVNCCSDVADKAARTK